ncbi:hypothetical protein PCIT_a0240 [Pseudoalteromonas citrea]|uniref:Flavodoxin-like fold domain-containing protein n=2 Tax=Pseudoalteromonas citrea TaxID=43655 RepID=A0AAD4AKA4_9GAMM|nr:NAD(P)H-dependent oxidoreductase [Pseudoalteromonas citrea]KAF7773898.1 hypothetical protein PCIT_a0240 [Pseudoalteromonas citrea]
MKILVILAHPDINNGSNANKVILDALIQQQDIKVKDLHTLYPDSKIDVLAEQSALLESDLIVFQHPLHWYSVPSVLKEWMDSVLLYGFAYGEGGNKLLGKKLLISTTIGGPEESYRPGGHNSFPMSDFLKPLQQTALFCGMDFINPILSYGMVYIPQGNASKNDIQRRAECHAKRLIETMNELKGSQDLERFA